MREYNWSSSVRKYLENSNGREIVIMGNDVFTLEIYYTLKFLHYTVPYGITNNQQIAEEIGIEFRSEVDIDRDSNIYNFFLFAGLSGHKEAYTLLIEKGFTLNKDFAIMGIGGYTKMLDSIDSLLTLNRVDEDIVGFRKYSNSEETGYKIVVLGNSTADPSTGNLRSWTEILFDKLSATNKRITIYNGAITGYSSTQEFLKLNRDVLALNPNMVISFSGYNDIIGNSTVEKFPYLHKYENKFFEFIKQNPKLAPDSMYVRNVSMVTHGLQNLQKDYEIWINNMRKMHAVCEEFSIKFRAYLQPMVEYMGPYKSKEQQQIIDEFVRITQNETMAKDEKAFCEGAKSKIYKYPYIKDLSGVFEGKYNMFYDTCHCTEKGNALLADIIYDDLLKMTSIGE